VYAPTGSNPFYTHHLKQGWGSWNAEAEQLDPEKMARVNRIALPFARIDNPELNVSNFSLEIQDMNAQMIADLKYIGPARIKIGQLVLFLFARQQTAPDLRRFFATMADVGLSKRYRPSAFVVKDNELFGIMDGLHRLVVYICWSLVSNILNFYDSSCCIHRHLITWSRLSRTSSALKSRSSFSVLSHFL